MATETYDVVVVGGGTAGCVVAARLSDAGALVCLIEAGPSDLANPVVSDIRNWLTVLGGPLDYSVPMNEPHARLSYSVGRLLGGSSSLNNSWAFETPRWDIDRWKAGGMSTVMADSLESTRLRVRAAIDAVAVENGHPASEAFLRGMNEYGFEPADLGRESLRQGAGWVRLAADGTLRRSAATVYLHDAPREGMTVMVGTRVDHVLIGANGKAQGVLTEHGPVLACQVVLCAGALQTPALVMRSGVGPATHLSELGIEVRCDQPNVGRHLQDHPLTGVTWRARQSEPTIHSHGWEAAAFTSGALTSEQYDSCILFSTMPSPFGIPADSAGLAGGGYTLAAYLARPSSRGSVRLRSSDPAAAPVVSAPFLTDAAGADRAAMARAVTVLRAIARTPALNPWLGAEVEPGARITGDGIAEYVSATLGTMFHPTSSCRMGSDAADSVVDEDFRVWGIDGLRICDASVLPSIPTVPPYLTCLMFAERCSEVMTDDERK